MMKCILKIILSLLYIYNERLFFFRSRSFAFAISHFCSQVFIVQRCVNVAKQTRQHKPWAHQFKNINLYNYRKNKTFWIILHSISIDIFWSENFSVYFPLKRVWRNIFSCYIFHSLYIHWNKYCIKYLCDAHKQHNFPHSNNHKSHHITRYNIKAHISKLTYFI